MVPWKARSAEQASCHACLLQVQASVFQSSVCNRFKEKVLERGKEPVAGGGAGKGWQVLSSRAWMEK